MDKGKQTTRQQIIFKTLHIKIKQQEANSNWFHVNQCVSQFVRQKNNVSTLFYIMPGGVTAIKDIVSVDNYISKMYLNWLLLTRRFVNVCLYDNRRNVCGQPSVLIQSYHPLNIIFQKKTHVFLDSMILLTRQIIKLIIYDCLNTIIILISGRTYLILARHDTKWNW